VDERADQSGVPSGTPGQKLVQPGGDPVEFFVAFGQDAGVDQSLSDVVFVAAGRELVQELVAKWFAARGQFAEQAGVRAPQQPA
jgi:hypothetical protein